MTIAVASHQRREPLLRLLRALDEQLAADDEVGCDVDVVVVIDGSTDGSAQAVRAGRWSVPVDVMEQEHRGLAAARNAGLAAARGGVVWFLDDDLLPSPGLVGRHRRAHATTDDRILVGPCRIPEEVAATPALAAWWDRLHAELAAAGRVDRFDRFTAANASGPASVFESVGGFDERFVGYGFEDAELGVRLLRAETRIDFDAGAVAWHTEVPGIALQVRRERDEGENSARLAALHPDVVDHLFLPDPPSSSARRLLRASRLRSPRSLMATSHLALVVHRLAAGRLPRTARRAESLARLAARASGLASGDPTGALLRRALR